MVCFKPVMASANLFNPGRIAGLIVNLTLNERHPLLIVPKGHRHRSPANDALDAKNREAENGNSVGKLEGGWAVLMAPSVPQRRPHSAKRDTC